MPCELRDPVVNRWAGVVVDSTGGVVYNDSSALEGGCGVAAVSRGAERRLLRRTTVRKGQAHAGHTRRCAARYAGGDRASLLQAEQGIRRRWEGKLAASSRVHLTEKRRRAPFCPSARAYQKAQKKPRPGRHRSVAGRTIDLVQFRRNDEVRASAPQSGDRGFAPAQSGPVERRAREEVY